MPRGDQLNHSSNCSMPLDFFYAFNVLYKCQTLLHLNVMLQFNGQFQNLPLFIINYHVV
jgi:hypothetical protein